MSDVLDDPESSSLLRYLPYVVIALVWFYFRKDSGYYTINHPVGEILLLVFIVAVTQFVIWWSRYNQSKVVVNGHNGSIFGTPLIQLDSMGNKWAIFSTGFSLHPFPTKGKLSTLIIPESSLNRIGNSYASNVYVKKIDLYDLPNPIYTLLIRYKSDFNLKNIYYGYHTQEFSTSDPKINELLTYVDKLHRQINVYSDVIEGRNDVVVGEVKKAEELTGGRKGIFERLESIFKKQEENESS